MSEREIFTALVDLWKNGGIKQLGRFILDGGYDCGVTNLPESYIPMTKREEMKKLADDGGWPR